MPTENIPPHDANGFVKFAEDYEVASWSPGKVEEQIPPTQIHLIIRPMGDGTVPAIVMRLKSRRAIDELLKTLKDHRDFVFGRIIYNNPNNDGFVE